MLDIICILTVIKDTIRDFDDMSNAFPWRSQVSFVPQANFISLHQSHIWGTAGKTDTKEDNFVKYTTVHGVKTTPK